MGKGRLEAFTDGVIAIIITIMVLEMKVPEGGSLEALRGSVPVFLAYALSYINVGLVWNNHHHMLQATERVDGTVLWANLFLLFWMSLIPFVIRWMDQAHFTATPTAAYGVVLVMMGFAYMGLERTLIRVNGSRSKLALAVGEDSKGKLSISTYLVAIPLSFVRPWIALVLYVAVALMWFIPDKRIESILEG